MDSNDIADKVAPDLSRPGHGAGNSPLLGRKSVLMGMLTSGFLVEGAAHASSATAAPIKPGSVAATTSQYVSLWASATAYAVGQRVISPNSDVVTANIAHTSAAAYATDVAKWTLSSTYQQAKSLPINLTHPAFGGKVDGITDDSAAWVLAIAAANARQCAIYVPAGVSIVTRATYLPDLTAPNASVVGDPSGGSEVSFTAAGGGFSVGNGTNYVYCTKFQNLAINGNGLCAKPLRFRMCEEADLLNLSVLSAATSCITVSGTSLLTSRRLTLSSSPIGVQIGNGCGYLSFLQSNLYLLTEPFQITGTQLTRFVFTDGWTEMCPDLITINAPGLSPSIGEILVNDSFFTSTLTNNRVFRAVAASSISMVRCRILGCYFNLPSGTSPLVDFTAVNNTSDIHLTLNDLDLTMAAALGSQVLVKPHASQAWYLFYVDAQRIAGVSANRWSAPPCVTGGVRSAPSELQGTGTPQGQFTAFPGSTYRRLDGGAGTSFYVKETGTGNTGWVAK